MSRVERLNWNGQPLSAARIAKVDEACRSFLVDSTCRAQLEDWDMMAVAYGFLVGAGVRPVDITPHDLYFLSLNEVP